MKQLISDNAASIVFTIWLLIYLYPAFSYAFFNKKIKSPMVKARPNFMGVASFFLYGIMGYLIPNWYGSIALGVVVKNSFGYGMDRISGWINGKHASMYNEPFGQAMSNIAFVLMGFTAGKYINLQQYPDVHIH